MLKTLAVAIVAFAFTLSSPCPLVYDPPLWRATEDAEAVVLGTLVCTTERLGDRFDPGDIFPPGPEAAEQAARWSETRVVEARTVRVLEEWIGTVSDPLVAATGSSYPCGAARDDPWETEPIVIFLWREGASLSFWADSELASPDSAKSTRAMRRAVERAVELREGDAPEWKVLDWLADLIAVPATRGRGLQDAAVGWWLFPELDSPPVPAERFSAAQRQRIAAAFLAEPAPGATLPAMLGIVGDSPDPRILVTALDAMERSLAASDGPWDDGQPTALWFPATVAWFGRRFDLSWASLWADQLWDPDSGFLFEDVRSVWPEARGRIEEAIERGRVVEDSATTETVEAGDY